MNCLEYSLTSLPNDNYDKDTLHSEIEAVTTNEVKNIVDTPSSVIIVFADDITDSEAIDAVVSSHTGDLIKKLTTVVGDAVTFFSQLTNEFAAYNILLGITQLNRTRDVADYLVDILRYGQTGSLYEVCNEIDILIEDGVSEDLAPFVTEEKLLTMQTTILEYLT